MKKIGLVLSGGMAKGAYQIGALRAIAEYIKPCEIQYVSAASVGALNSYAFSSNNLKTAEDMWRSLNQMHEKLFLTTLLKSEYLKDTVVTLVENSLVCDCFYLPLYRLKARELLYADIKTVEKDNQAEYLYAAVAFYPAAKPVIIDGSAYCDGAVVDNIPIYPLFGKDLDYIICIYFDDYNYTFESKCFDGKVIKIAFDNTPKNLSASLCFRRENIAAMIGEGERRAKEILSFVFSNDIEDSEKIYARIHLLNLKNRHKQIRITGDMIFNNINIFAKKMMRHRTTK